MPHESEREAKTKMHKSLEAFRQELTTIRTGRASVGLLDGIEVDAYGAKMKLNQVANVTAPEVRLLIVAPWDKTQMKAISMVLAIHINTISQNGITKPSSFMLNILLKDCATTCTIQPPPYWVNRSGVI